jgi:hypothetical protein
MDEHQIRSIQDLIQFSKEEEEIREDEYHRDQYLLTIHKELCHIVKDMHVVIHTHIHKTRRDLNGIHVFLHLDTNIRTLKVTIGITKQEYKTYRSTILDCKMQLYTALDARQLYLEDIEIIYAYL